MDNIKTNEQNIHLLLKKICLNILQEYGAKSYNLNNVVARLKSKAYEILLKRSKKAHIVEKESIDPERALNVYIFSRKLYAHGRSSILKTVVELEECAELIKEGNDLSQDACKNVLLLLLILSNDVVQENEMSISCSPSLLRPGPFTLFGSYKNNQHYPTFNWDIMSCQLKYLPVLPHIRSKENPYLPKFLFKEEPTFLASFKSNLKDYNIKKEKNVSSIEELRSFSFMTKHILKDNKVCLNIDILRSSTITETNANLIPKFTTILCEKVCDDSTINETRRLYSWNWECLGCFGALCSKPFVCECNVMTLLKHYVQLAEQKTFRSKIISRSHFLNDLKSLCVGIQSDIFQYNESIVFSMLPNVTVTGILSDTVHYFVQEFLECGTCYKRIQIMIMKKDYELLFDGYMFKALCNTLNEYLMMFRQCVFVQKDEHLIEFSIRIKKFMKQLINLSYTLGVHPSAPVNVKPPMGPQFLGYIYREIIRLNERDYCTLLLCILKNCCNVYFKNLQKWIYYGVLDDPCNELFIGFVTHYPQNTKHFYDKAYYIRKEWVPGFFQNFEDRILQCGKYTMLLKAFKPNHPLFNLEYPSISVCLSFQELDKLKQECMTYYNKARALCAHPVSIRQYFKQRAEEKRVLFTKMIEKSRANLERWTDEQYELALITAEQKKKRLQELTNQLEHAKQKKIGERKTNVELVLKQLKEVEKLEKQSTLQNNINLRKRIEYYQELNDMLKEKELSANCSGISSKNFKKHLKSELITFADEIKNPQTPISGSESREFESCCTAEEEQTLEYEECASDGFAENIAKTGKHLSAKYDSNYKLKQTYLMDEEGNLVNIKTIHSMETPTFASFMESDNKSGITDILNFTESNGGSANTVQQNRLKVLSGSNVRQCLREPLHIKDSTKVQLDNENANKNRNGLEKSQFSINLESNDIKLNTLSCGETALTEMQRNRNRNMQTNLFKEYNEEPSWLDRAKLPLNVNTERARIRHKVLESEFNIIDSKPNVTPTAQAVKTTLTTSTARELLHNSTSPMSTTSDDDCQTLAVGSLPVIDVSVINESNVKNGNIESLTGHKAKAKDTIIHINEKMEPPKISLSTYSKFTEEQGALNTLNKLNEAYLPSKLTDKQQQVAFNESVIEHNEFQAAQSRNAWLTSDYTQPYTPCAQLLHNNFKCRSYCQYICLRKASEDVQATEPLSQIVNSLSVITLTEFLQKSISIPMDTHLQLINNEIMRMLLNDLHILDHFRSLRNYYFLMDGEFGAIICDGIIGKLEDGAAPETLFNYQVLHSILDTALSSSLTGNDKNADNLSFVVSHIPERFDLTCPNVLNNLSLCYRINWPLNLVLTAETLDQYAKIFKYLLRVRRISWILEKAYKILQDIGKRYGSAVLASPQYRRVQLIRHKFYHLVHTLQNHITSNALQASWRTFKEQLLNATSIEAIYHQHAMYIKRILFLCMLNKYSTEFHNAIENIFKISLRFYNNLSSRKFKLVSGQTHFTHSRYEKLLNDEMELDKYIKYTIYLGNKIVRHGYQAEIGEFISLVNFNQYYL